MVSFTTAVKNGFKKTFDYSGLATLSEYWWWFLFRLVVWFVIMGLFALLADATGEESFIFIGFIMYLLLLIPSLSLAVRRLHDSGHSGSSLLLLLIPFPIAQYYVFYWLTQPSNYKSEYRKQAKNIKNTQNQSISNISCSTPLNEKLEVEHKVLEVENTNATIMIPTDHSTETSIVQESNEKVTDIVAKPEQKKGTDLPQWIQNWDIKKYNRYFVQLYVLYHLFFLLILYANIYDYEFRYIWRECDWYITFQFIIPYVIYLGIRYYAEIKLKLAKNEDK